MRILTLLVIALSALPATTRGQDVIAPEGTRIAAADVSGVALDQLSPGLRTEIASLAGAALSQARLRDLAARIEAEQPGTVAAVRNVTQPSGEVRIVFLVARISESDDLQSNINARYVVESVEISGIDENIVAGSVRDELKTLIGKPMDPKEAERLETILDASLTDHDVARRIERGTHPGQVKVIFDVTPARLRWIPFSKTLSKLTYHAYQGWSGALDTPMGSRNHRFTIGGVIENEDDLVEQYSGWRFGFESSRLGTDRLGASLEFSTLSQTWREATLDAIDAGGFPVAYRARRTIEPRVTFAFTPGIRIRGGMSVSDLESLSHSPESAMASALVADVIVDHKWAATGDATHRIVGNYSVRSASAALNSDLAYTRHHAGLTYLFSRRRETITSTAVFGRITGEAPMFERFTLGDTSTLRGWNKYDIVPAGASRVFHHTVEYRYRAVGAFLDSGAAWDDDTGITPRFSTGLRLTQGPLFVTLGVPLNADKVRVTFMAGFRMGLYF